MEAELIEAVADGVELSPEEDRCVYSLKQLKKFPVSYQLLVSTQFGKQLRRLTEHPRKRFRL